jgi:N-acylglucosamine 2-epimerase
MSETDMLLARYRRELFENVVPFWERYGIDREMGGYFTCLDRDGALYSTDKYMWLQGRAVWMFSRLHNEVSRDRGWLDLAQQGLDFIRAYGRAPDGRVYFSLTRDGRPIHIQRKIYSEVFFVMALAEMARATGSQEYLNEAKALFWQTYTVWKEPERLGRPMLPGRFVGTTLADPMVFLGMVEELARLDDPAQYDAVVKEMKGIALRHIHGDRQLVLENVGPAGEFVDTPVGRLLNPGHAIELAWFLIHLAQRTGDADLIAPALDIVDWSLARGWDAEHGGLYYFLDSEGRPPLPLEWSMKLWWPITEAMYATLLAWDVSGELRFLEWHRRIAEWGFTHLHDAQGSEWFGYLDRRGEPTHTLKGGAWKGFIHLPRALLYSVQLLERRSVGVSAHVRHAGAR